MFSTPGEYPRAENLKDASLGFETGLERLDRDKHSSLLQKSVKYGRKKFYSAGIWL